MVKHVVEAHRARIWPRRWERWRRVRLVRLDRALLNDVRTVFRSRPLLFFFALELLAGGVFVMRRGEQTVTTVLLIWVGMLILAFFAWWAGRHRLAHPRPDPVPGATARAVFALIGVAGMMLFGFSMAVGFVLITSGIGGWLYRTFGAVN